jgi:tetratricopeptide (TPR) repeat protein
MIGRREVLKRSIGIAGLFVLISFFAFCASAEKSHMKAYAEYAKGNYEKAIEYFEPLKTKQDKNYLLYMMDIGTTYFSAGDFYDSEKYFMTVEKSLDKQISDLKTAEQLVVSDQQKIFFGDPHDKVMTHIFLGLGYFIRSDYVSAEIEFKKALESDRGKEQKYEGDLVIPSYFLSEIFTQKGEYDNAKVAAKRIAEINPSFPYAWLKLYELSEKEGNKDDMEKYLSEYKKCDPNSSMIEAIQGKSRMLIIDMLGWGPQKQPDPLLGAMSLTEERPYKDFYCTVDFYKGENQPAATSRDYLADDVYFQASTQGGFGSQLTKKAVGIVARKAISQIPIVGSLAGLIFGGDEADVRYWYTLPGRINLSVVYLYPGIYHTKFSMLDKTGKEQERYRQVWYYVPVNQDKTTILVIRSLYDLQNQAKKG